MLVEDLNISGRKDFWWKILIYILCLTSGSGNRNLQRDKNNLLDEESTENMDNK